MTISFGRFRFDAVEYDGQWDLLYLRCSDNPAPDEWDVSEEGDALAYRGADLISVDVMDAALRLQEDGEILLTLEDGSVLRSPDVHLAITQQAA